MPLRPPPNAEDRLRGIRSVTDAALSHLGAYDLLTTLLGRVREILDADTAAVLLDSSGRQLIATAASGLEEEVSQGVRIPVGQGFAVRIVGRHDERGLAPVANARITTGETSKPAHTAPDTRNGRYRGRAYGRMPGLPEIGSVAGRGSGLPGRVVAM
jgi:hypothetical protein